MTSKFHNQPTYVDGKRFDSKKEARRYQDLKLLQKLGKIKDLQCQVSYPLQGKFSILRYDSKRPATYVADFVYIDCQTEKKIIEDTKGMKTPLYKLKKAIMKDMGHTIYES